MATLAQSALSDRERMRHIINIANDNKVEAMLILSQDLEEGDELSEYSDDLKKQLYGDFAAYKAGEKTYSKQEVKVHTDQLLKSFGNF